jgi:hypothetical protein
MLYYFFKEKEVILRSDPETLKSCKYLIGEFHYGQEEDKKLYEYVNQYLSIIDIQFI